MDTISSTIDSMDARILGEIRREARISWRELGDRVHLAPTSVAERVRRLEQQGVIQGYEARIEARDEVVFGAYVTGSAYYKVIVECAGADGLDRFVRWLRADEVVARTESQLVLRTIVD